MTQGKSWRATLSRCGGLSCNLELMSEPAMVLGCGLLILWTRSRGSPSRPAPLKAVRPAGWVGGGGGGMRRQSWTGFSEQSSDRRHQLHGQHGNRHECSDEEMMSVVSQMQDC